jgi:tight adherence protein B
LLKKRTEKFDEQLVDGLSLIANGLKAGYSLTQALNSLANEMGAPISQEFGLVLKENRMGVPIEQALANLAQRIKSEDLDLFVTAVLTMKQVGGNLAEIFDRITDTIRERNKLYGKINALTAQGRMQGIVVGLLPLFLGFVLYKIQPDMMRPLFTDPIGWCAIGLLIVFEVIGAVLIKKIVTIDV